MLNSFSSNMERAQTLQPVPQGFRNSHLQNHTEMSPSDKIDRKLGEREIEGE